MNVGRLVIPAIRWREEDGFATAGQVIEPSLEFGAGGFILFGGSADEVSELTDRIRRDAGRPLLFAADLERGPGQQFSGLDELPPPLALASLEDPAVLRGAGILTAVQALSVGINWVLAPVADLDGEPENPIVQTRSFGADPAAAGAAVAAWIVGCEAAGALSCAKHFPGHGRTRVDSHISLPVVDASSEALRADLEPFIAAVEAGVSSVMTAHVSYPALDPSGRPATFSEPILGLLRRDLGFTGLIVTDALIMAGARQGRPEGEACRDALEAGVDLLLYPDQAEAVVTSLDSLAGDSRGAARLEASLARYEAALAALDDGGSRERLPSAGSSRAAADWLLSQGMLRGQPPVLRTPLELLIVDDDEGQTPPPSSTTWVADALRELGVPLGPGGSRVVLGFSEPRGWKGWVGFGSRTREALERAANGRGGGKAGLVVLFTHPRHLPAVPAGPPVLCAWHRQRLMQEAVARWLAGRLA